MDTHPISSVSLGLTGLMDPDQRTSRAAIGEFLNIEVGRARLPSRRRRWSVDGTGRGGRRGPGAESTDRREARSEPRPLEPRGAFDGCLHWEPPDSFTPRTSIARPWRKQGGEFLSLPDRGGRVGGGDGIGETWQKRGAEAGETPAKPGGDTASAGNGLVAGGDNRPGCRWTRRPSGLGLSPSVTRPGGDAVTTTRPVTPPRAAAGRQPPGRCPVEQVSPTGDPLRVSRPPQPRPRRRPPHRRRRR